MTAQTAHTGKQPTAKGGIARQRSGKESPAKGSGKDPNKRDAHDIDKDDGLDSGGALTGRDLIDEAKRWVEDKVEVEPGYCLRTVRTIAKVPALYVSASEGWQGAEHKHWIHTGASVPAAVPVWWTGGSDGSGHVAISDGNGGCYSTDFFGSGFVYHVSSIDEIAQTWTALTLRGWSRDLNGVVLRAPEKDDPDQPGPPATRGEGAGDGRGPRIDAALASLAGARKWAKQNGNSTRANTIDSAIKQLMKLSDD